LLVSLFSIFEIQQHDPIAVSGWNRDVVVESTASAAIHILRLEREPGENKGFYATGCRALRGPPSLRSFVSMMGMARFFKFLRKPETTLWC